MTGLARIANDLFPADDFFNDFMADRLSPLKVQGISHETTEDSLIVSFDVPGVTKEDLKATVYNRYLTVEANTDKRNHFYRVKIGNGVDTETSEHSLENGVLTITFPLSKERQERNILA